MTTLAATSHINGRSPSWRWLAGVVVGLLLAVGGYLYAQTQRRIERTEDAITAIRDLATAANGLVLADRDRLTMLETRLFRIEDKLDRALERVKKP